LEVCGIIYSEVQVVLPYSRRATLRRPSVDGLHLEISWIPDAAIHAISRVGLL